MGHEVKRAFNKISVPLKIKVVTGSEKKRKANEMSEAMEDKEETIEQNGDAETTDKKKKKKKNDLEDQYKNVDLPSFAVVDTINADEVSETPEPKKKKAKNVNEATETPEPKKKKAKNVKE